MTQSSETIPPAAAISPPRKPRRWLRVLLIVVVFIGGMGVGAGATVIVAVHRLKQAIIHPERLNEIMAERLERRLSLDGEQAAKVRSILTERQRRTAEIRRRFRPALVAEMDRTYEEIRAVLDEKQRTRWERMYRELKADWLPPMPPESASSRSIPATPEP